MSVAERAYVDACKWIDSHSGVPAVCVVCDIYGESEHAPPFFLQLPAHHFHHFCSGGIRVGHLWGIGCCVWHHERHPIGQMSHRQMEDYYGPSLKGGSAVFHDLYGSDVELLAHQDSVLRLRGIEPPVRGNNRRWAA